jgi:hypothetical protein
MTVTDFTTLALPDQLEFLYAEGVYLAKRKTADQTIILYQLNQLYIEIFYKKYRRVVNNIRCSNSMDILCPYLENIPIEDLFT